MHELKRLIRGGLQRVAPRAAVTILSMRARAHSQRMVREWGLTALNDRLRAAVGGSVVGGPFAGMVLSPRTWREHVGPFLLGSYESELHPWIEDVIGSRPTQVVDVGAKFGYYAVGLARRLPGTPGVAFDTDPWARAAVREMAIANGVGDRVEVRGFCDAMWFDRSLIDGAFILSDCEGYERELFPAIRTPALRSATVHIELHDGLAPGATDAIVRTFGETHEARGVESTPWEDPPLELPGLSASEAARVAREIRDPQHWMLFTPRTFVAEPPIER